MSKSVNLFEFIGVAIAS